jgi:divalent metal cation (Fe/Co/Zn/Cd) transporter
MNSQELKRFFNAHKADIPDDGFSERVVRRLPKRQSVLPQLIMPIFIIIGLILTFATPGFAPVVIEQIDSLVNSISHSQMPSASSIAVYLGLLALLGTIGFSVAKVDVG